MSSHLNLKDIASLIKYRAYANEVRRDKEMFADGGTKKVRLSSTNYSLWEFQLRVLVEGRGLLGILNGTTAPPGVTSQLEGDHYVGSKQCKSEVMDVGMHRSVDLLESASVSHDKQDVAMDFNT
ncbi:unnamed protein product [Linum trigynum]|uniref:Retrotransposon Copia-like N-terminal domain-containing protein n=1 Tax=Linum trigynum TaxID=586398 RepID=A0AAV2G7S3_9ROSI